MFTQILVPLDGSKRAESALPVAARIARTSGASIVLLRVVPLPSDYYSRFIGVSPLAAPYTYSQNLQPYADQAIDAEIAAAKGYLEIIARDVLAGMATHIEVASGPAAASILFMAESLAADLIIMCSHGYTGFKRWTLGSVSQKVARQSSVPVLVLCEGAGVPTNLHPEGMRPVRVLVALDGSALSETALVPAAQLSAALSAPAEGELHLVQVIHFPEEAGEGQSGVESKARELAKAAAQAYLKTQDERLHRGDLARLNLHTTWSVIANTDVAHALINAAELGAGMHVEHGFSGCDVIAMATHGRSGPQLWMVGSVTERVLSATKLPLLVVRPPKMKAKVEEAHAGATGAVASTGSRVGLS